MQLNKHQSGAAITADDWVSVIGSVTGRARINVQQFDPSCGHGPSVTIRVPFYRVRRAWNIAQERGPAMIAKQVKPLSLADHLKLWKIQIHINEASNEGEQS